MARLNCKGPERKELVSCDETTVEALKARLKQTATIAEFQRACSACR